MIGTTFGYFVVALGGEMPLSPGIGCVLGTTLPVNLAYFISQTDMLVRVKVRASPYYNVPRGTVGEVVSRKFIGTPHEVLRIQCEDGSLWSFFPDEIELLDGKPV